MGEQIHFIKLGSGGTPLVMLHGWGKSLATLRPLAELLATERTVYVLDLPGFGHSPPPPSPWGTAEYTECVVDFLNHERLVCVDLLGHSFGGRISVRLAATHPERVRKLVLMSSHGLVRRRTWRERLRITAIGALRAFVRRIDGAFRTRWYADWFVQRFGSRDYLAAGELRATFVKTVNEDLSAIAPGIQAETLLLWGDSDTETPPEFAERYGTLIKRSRVLILPGKGHEPYENAGHHLCAYFLAPFFRERTT